MIKNENVRAVTEDAVVGNKCCKSSSKTYGDGYDGFVYPYTVSFYSEGKYEVIIKGRKATVRKVE